MSGRMAWLQKPCCARSVEGTAQGKHGIGSCSRSKGVAPGEFPPSVLPKAAAFLERRSEWCTPMPSTNAVSFWRLSSLTHGSRFFQSSELPRLDTFTSFTEFLEDQLSAYVFFLTRNRLCLLSWYR